MLDMKFQDLITDHGRFIYGIYEELNVEGISFKELLRKRTLLLAKAIP